MAKLIPHSSPSDIELQPERRVAEALCSQLPADVLVFHSYPWLRKDRDLDRPGSKETLREGEADFVIVDPRFGFMVVEVKGGKMFFDAAALRWDRHGATHAVKDPFAQASTNLRALEKLIRDRSFAGCQQLPFARARCVVFPNSNAVGSLPPGADRSILFVASDLKHLGKRIEALFRLQAFVPSARLLEHTLNGITHALTSTFRLVPALWRDVEDQEQVIFRLTEQQILVLDFIHSHTRAAIKGVAGSGKTFLAMTKARRFADEGKRVLFVCFTKMLAEWQETALPGRYREQGPGGITVCHYHKLCADWVKRAGLDWSNKPTAEWWANDAPRLLEQAIDVLPERFDAVVVDEAQDFLSSWWDPLELILERPMEGPFYLFYDPAQTLYHTDSHCLPDLGQHFDLIYNCRNTIAIAEVCGRVIQRPIATNDRAVRGGAPKFIHATTKELQLAAVDAQVRSWLGEGNLRKSQVAVLTAYPVENGPCAGVKTLGGHTVTDDLDDWRTGKAILVTTVGKFKGLEADAIVIADVPDPEPTTGQKGFGLAHLYVACSRAKHLLSVIGRDAAVGDLLQRR